MNTFCAAHKLKDIIFQNGMILSTTSINFHDLTLNKIYVAWPTNQDRTFCLAYQPTKRKELLWWESIKNPFCIVEQRLCFMPWLTSLFFFFLYINSNSTHSFLFMPRNTTHNNIYNSQNKDYKGVSEQKQDVLLTWCAASEGVFGCSMQLGPLAYGGDGGWEWRWRVGETAVLVLADKAPWVVSLQAAPKWVRLGWEAADRRRVNE